MKRRGYSTASLFRLQYFTLQSYHMMMLYNHDHDHYQKLLRFLGCCTFIKNGQSDLPLLLREAHMKQAALAMSELSPCENWSELYEDVSLSTQRYSRSVLS